MSTLQAFHDWFLRNQDKLPVLVYLELSACDNPNSIAAACNRLEVDLDHPSKGAFYPSRCEVLSYYTRSEDVLVLNEIAREMGTFRPRTCQPGKRCQQDPGKVTVSKRSNSCKSEHVRLLDPDDNPPCHFPLTVQGYTLIHEEYVDMLQTFGEFRIFLAVDHSAPSKDL
ncbi:hypothetical protein BU26DRAFT_558989 [Trematosphaeria pertusa]|uniref:Uncharacterized protein n=1 Tax=Trematosphaeria pertusa TaxID=390896 RepID=A0A6A6IUQ6_9PLEO|nr:uncharacterized protein BU26DRAFT_558989 [Trematosphaeria pertusa]KAF2254291.1 hypothetical protein BU26DRAFT_558989 [Trematosphaeria pertusa]